MRKWTSIFLLLTAAAVRADAVTTEFEYQLDAYYSAVDLNINLSTAPIPYYKNKTEFEIYRDLILTPRMPRYIVLEASVNPLPLTGTYVKRQARTFYDDMQLSPSVNIIRSVTAGFEEPAALSIFMGNVVDFKPVKKRSYGEGKGYIGALLSMGHYHIKDNDLIRDHWLEGEWKIKGDQKVAELKLQWSFRLGAKFHANRDITDVFYLGLRRSRTDYNERTFSWIKNSGIQYKFDFGAKSLKNIQHQLIVDKKFPWKKGGPVPTLSIGLTWRDSAKYTGALRDTTGQKFEFLFQPNLEF